MAAFFMDIMRFMITMGRRWRSRWYSRRAQSPPVLAK
jgi:hypothetical protein